MALGAPCFFGGDGDNSGDSSGRAVGNGVSDGDVDLAGVSNGSGDDECFFFRWSEAVGEVSLSFAPGVGEPDSSSVDGVLFFFGEGVTDGDGDFCFVVDALLFFRGFGVGVGVAKIFLIASPNDCSACTGASSESRIEITMQRRIDMDNIGRRKVEIS